MNYNHKANRIEVKKKKNKQQNQQSSKHHKLGLKENQVSIYSK